MKNPFILLCQALSICRSRSKVPTAIRPLSSLKKAAVIFDADAPDAQKCATAVKEYFASRYLSCDIYALSAAKPAPQLKDCIVIGRRNCNIYHRPKRSKKHPAVDYNTGLLVDLTLDSLFTQRYIMRCSKAGFKIGRSADNSPYFDIVISNSETYSQSEVFSQMASLLNTIK